MGNSNDILTAISDVEIDAHWQNEETPVSTQLSPAAGAANLWNWKHLACVTIVAILVFINSISNEFIWDDVYLIVDNPTIREPGNIGKAFTTHYWDLGDKKARIAGNYRPLTIASFILNYQLTGPSPEGFRIVNIAIHALNSCLLYILALLLGLPSLCALAAGLIFACHFSKPFTHLSP